MEDATASGREHARRRLQPGRSDRVPPRTRAGAGPVPVHGAAVAAAAALVRRGTTLSGGSPEYATRAACAGRTHPRRFVRRGRFRPDRKSTRLNSSHVSTSYAVFCLENKKRIKAQTILSA